LIAAAKRLEQARLLNFVRLSDYIIIDGLRVVLTNTLEEILYKIRNVNASKIQEDSLLELDSLGENIMEESSNTEESLNIEEFKKDLSIQPSIIQDSLPSTQYFIVELYIRNEILTFDPSYQNFETKVMKYTLTYQLNVNTY
jgi:hypothetical protein